MTRRHLFFLSALAALAVFAAADLPPSSRTNLKLVKSVNHQENDGHEEEQIHRGWHGRLLSLFRSRWRFHPPS